MRDQQHTPGVSLPASDELDAAVQTITDQIRMARRLRDLERKVDTMVATLKGIPDDAVMVAATPDQWARIYRLVDQAAGKLPASTERTELDDFLLIISNAIQRHHQPGGLDAAA